MSTPPRPQNSRSAAQGRDDSATPSRKLTEYEKGYLDGVLVYSYRSDGEVYVGRSRLTTYKSAALKFLSERGIDTEGWSVNVH